jgi:hypothetical protein
MSPMLERMTSLTHARLVRPVRQTCAMMLLLAALLAGCWIAGPASARGAEAGVGLQNPTPNQLVADRALGTHWVRMFVSWRALQPSQAPVSSQILASYEQLFSQLPAGTKVLLDIVDSPEWETGSGDENAPPANPADYASFVAQLAARWGSKVTAYEIWNEEDAPAWWVGGPDPAAYTRLLQATYPAVKAVDPGAKIILGGLTGNDYEFLEGVYRAGGKGYFDAVGVHTDTACNKLSPYEYLRGADGRLVPDSFLAYREVHAVMLANGDDKPIWMTELSWRTTAATCAEGRWAGVTAAGVSDDQQAVFLRQAYHCLAQDPYVQVALWFPLVDFGPAVSGLQRADGSEKPSFTAMHNYASAGDTLKEPCGNFTGPKIAVASPSNNKRYSGPLVIHVSATSGAGVFRIRLEIDGKLIRNYDAGTYPSSLAGTLEWQGAKHIPFGRHTLTILAYDKQRNVSQENISIVHTHPVTKKSKKKRHGHTNARRH